MEGIALQKRKTKSLPHRAAEQPPRQKKSLAAYLRSSGALYVMAVPGMLSVLLFSYVPMYGVLIAFQKYSPAKGVFGSEWVGLEHFQRMFSNKDFYNIVKNTLLLNVYDVIFGFPMPIILAVMLNEVNNRLFKRLTQSILYLPHFLSWVVLGGIIIQICSPSTGVINSMIKAFGGESIYFMADAGWWVVVFVVSGIWQGAGWGTIVYLAAVTGIDMQLYEAARIDGAGKFRQIWHITLPGIRSTIATMLILRMGSMMNIGFEKVYMLQNNAVRRVSEVISTYVYRLGIEGAQFSYTTAIGLFQSLISLILVFTTNKIIKSMGETGLW